MPIDTSIISRLQPSQFKVADPMDQVQKSLTLQHLMGQQDMQGMQMRQAQQGVEDQTRLRALLGSNPKDLESELLRGGFVDQSLKIGKDRRENTKLEADTLKAKSDAEKNSFDTQLKRLEHGASILDSARDQGSWDSALRIGAATGVFAPEFIQKFQGQPFNPQIIEQLKAAGIDRAKQLVDQRAREQQAETGRHNLSTEANAAGQLKVSQGQLGVAQGNLGVSRDRLRMEQDAPKGTYDPARGVVVDTRSNTASPVMMDGVQLGAAPQKPTEAYLKNQTGVENVRNAIVDYRTALKDFSPADILRPDARAKMGTAYNNMMLQAKEAYNLGVLNGPDYKILQAVVADPTNPMSAMKSKSALDAQAKHLDKIMEQIGKTSATVHGQPVPNIQRNAESADAPITATNAAGQKIQLVNGKWEPIK